MGHALPSESEETADPEGTDDEYEAAVTVLRSATRDRLKFPLVFTENCNYGFRRNLWGMRAYGLTLALLGTFSCWTLVTVTGDLLSADTWGAELARNPARALVTQFVGAIANTCIAATWIFFVKPRWVKTPADAYAQRLFEALDVLAPHNENDK